MVWDVCSEIDTQSKKRIELQKPLSVLQAQELDCLWPQWLQPCNSEQGRWGLWAILRGTSVRFVLQVSQYRMCMCSRWNSEGVQEQKSVLGAMIQFAYNHLGSTKYLSLYTLVDYTTERVDASSSFANSAYVSHYIFVSHVFIRAALAGVFLAHLLVRPLIKCLWTLRMPGLSPLDQFQSWLTS